jgi:hypothetical protein
MPVTYWRDGSIPEYYCLSTDVTSGCVIGASTKGSKVFFTDTGTWWLIGDNLKLIPYALPIAVSNSGSAPAHSGSSVYVTNLSEVQLSISGSGIIVTTASVVQVTNFPSTQVTSGCVTNFPATQITSGCITNLPAIQTISGSVMFVIPGASASSLGKAEDAPHASGDVGVEVLAVRTDILAPSSGVSGDYETVKTDANGALWVTLGTRLDSTNDSITVVGGAAYNTAVSGSPILNAGYAINAEPSAVSNGYVARLLTDLVGKLIILPYANPENFVSGVTSVITGSLTTSLIAAPAAGLRNYITQVIATNAHATVGTFVNLQDGNNGATFYSGYAAPAGGGFAISFPTPLRQPSSASALYVACTITGASVVVAASGYKGI